ncbi:MAG: helix-turn-helix transcriptional regulator [Collinsella sp.]
MVVHKLQRRHGKGERMRVQRGFCIAIVDPVGSGGVELRHQQGASHCVPAGSWLFVKKLLACLAHVEWGREMNIASKVGSRIRILREAAGLTQSELAATAYVTRQSVGNWERGNTLPDVQKSAARCQALNTTVDGLLGDELPDMLEETAEARRQLSHCLAALGAIFALELLLAFLYSSFLRAPGSGEFRLVLSGMRVVLAFAVHADREEFRSIVSGQRSGRRHQHHDVRRGLSEREGTAGHVVLSECSLTNLPAFYTLYIRAARRRVDCRRVRLEIRCGLR